MKTLAVIIICVIAMVAVNGCSGAPETATGVEFGGCKTVLAGPVCVVDDAQTLLVWLPDDQHVKRIEADGKTIEPVATVPVQGGTRYTVEPGASASVLHFDIDDGQRRLRWRLALRRESDPPWLQTARTQRRAGDTATARASVQPALDNEKTPRRAAAFALLGRVELATGNHDEAQRLLRIAMTLHEAEDRPYDALFDGLALTFSLLHGDRQFTAARDVLDRFVNGTGQAEWSYLLAYHRGDAAAETGDTRAAMREFAAAAAIAERFDWPVRRLHSGQLLAVQLQQLGRRDDARAIFDAWSNNLPIDIGDCTRALFHTNVGWSDLLALEAGEPVEVPLDALQLALALASEHCSAGDVANAHVNLALAYLHGNDAITATHHLGQARAAVAKPPLRLALWALDIEARIAALQHDSHQAAELYEQLERLANATLSPAARWRAAIGKATLARNDGRLADAIAAFARADRLLTGDLARIPLMEGRESFVATRQWATRQHLAALLAADDETAAYRLARTTRQRVLYSLSPLEQIAARGPAATGAWEQALSRYEMLRAELSSEAQQRWSVPGDELARVEALAGQRRRELESILDDALPTLASVNTLPTRSAPGELLVLIHPLDDGWVVFADNGQSITAVQPDCDVHGNRAAQCLLEPLATQIGTAHHLVLMPTGSANGLDFHAAAFNGKPLAASVAVSYAADLQARQSSPPQAGQLLVVADPLGDLPGARTEAAAVQAALNDAAWNATLILGASADATNVRTRLAQSQLFHFAGHASFGGLRGWDSELRLAGDTVLSIGDILALPAPPPMVVLSGCETATTATRQLPDSMSLANAFIASGSDIVLAATRPVPDRTTNVLMESFYTNWRNGVSLPVALATAQAQVRASDPSADWAAFRLITRTHSH